MRKRFVIKTLGQLSKAVKNNFKYFLSFNRKTIFSRARKNDKVLNPKIFLFSKSNKVNPFKLHLKLILPLVKVNSQVHFFTEFIKHWESSEFSQWMSYTHISGHITVESQGVTISPLSKKSSSSWKKNPLNFLCRPNFACRFDF